MKPSFCIPADVPSHAHALFTKHYHRFTKGTDHILLFAADHFIEHPVKDLYGPTIDPQARNPQHVFEIAAASNISALATSLGLIARYAQAYSTINYIAKLNSKTDLIPLSAHDPYSIALWSIEQVMQLHQQGIPILGIGYTVYLGSEYESSMLNQAAQLVYQAHQQGLLAILWMYPRGKYVSHETDEALIAGAAGIGCALGADIVKVKIPEKGKNSAIQGLNLITQAAGNTRVICSGGARQDESAFLAMIQEYMHQTSIAGFAIGRNIFQLPQDQAIRLTKRISAMIFQKEQ